MRVPIALLVYGVFLAAQSAPAQVSPFPIREKRVTGSVDVGYRWVSDVSGDFNTYRSVVNLGEGPKLIGLDFFAEDPNRRLFDKLTVTADSWGGDPYNTARVDAERTGTYRFLFDYRNIAYFNFLPSFANPRIGDGILFNQRSFDTQRRLLNTELELRPGTRLVPFLGYSRDAGSGTGVTPFVTTGNEFPVTTNLDDKTDNYRGGVRFEMRRWHLTLEQGGTTFKDDQHVFTNEFNPGNRTTPLLGRELFLKDLSQSYRVRGDSIYSRGLFTAAPAGWLDLYGQFLYSQPQSDVRYRDDSQGLFYLGATRFFIAQQSLLTGETKLPHTSGSFSAELRPHRRLQIFESLMTDRLHNASSALLETAIVEAFADGFAQSDGSLFSLDRLVMNYNRQQVDVFFDITSKFTVRGGHRYEWGDSQVRPATLNPSGLPETGELKRHVALFGLNLRPTRNFRVNVDYEGSASDSSYFRTSLHDYHKLRARGNLQVLPSLEVMPGVVWLDNENPTPGVEYDFRNFAASMSLRWAPGSAKRVSFLGDYTWSSLRSDINFLDPGRLAPVGSFYRDNGHAATGLLDINLPTSSATIVPRITVGGSLFISSGSRPTRYYQPVGRFLLPLHRHVAWYAEWRWYGLSQEFYSFEGFRTHHFLTGLRLTL